MKKHKNYITYIILCLFISSCSTIKTNVIESNDDIDSWRNIKRQDVKNILLDIKNDYPTEELVDQQQYLDVSRLLATPPPPPIGNGKLISFSITEEVPLKDVFIELGRLADVDIQIDPQISTGIILKVTDKPLNVVLDKICDIANLKYEYNEGILKVERDLPYIVDYDVDILVEHELWNDIQSSIEYLLSVNPIQSQTTSSTDDMSIGNITNTTDIEQQIVVNKAASIISVYANSKAQKAVSTFIKKAKENYASQVLIEAKVVEVKLNDSYKAGINWTLTKNTTDADGNPIIDTLMTIVGAGGSTSGLTNTTFNKKINSKDLNVVIDAMQEFGDTKTLSSPRISALNNQKAKLDFINTLSNSTFSDINLHSSSSLLQILCNINSLFYIYNYDLKSKETDINLTLFYKTYFKSS